MPYDGDTEAQMDLAKEFDPKGIEAGVRARLSGVDLEGLISKSGNRETVAFIEGPPTMNGIPHAGHLRGRVMKDFWYRYETLRGKNVIFNAGWDTQGLPVELQAQKELGVEGGREEIIRTVGIERLVQECKSIVKKYNEKWVHLDGLLGMSFNQKNAYWTFHDSFIEREWQFLRRANEAGILEDDHTVIAYCPSCQTSLSHAEVGQAYEEVTDPSVYYKVRLAGEDAFLVVWTTMPFTLVTDAMVGLAPDEEYHTILVDGERWIVGKTRLEGFLADAGITEYTIQQTRRGAEFEGKKYVHPLYDVIPELKKLASAGNYHMAVSEEFVDAGAGSGLVHLSPANGEEDIRVANRRGVKVFCPIDDGAKFTEDAGRYAGLFVRDADRQVIADLEAAGALVKARRIRHKYPLCWRSRHRVVWLARRGWFYKLDRLENMAIEAAEGVEYFFEQPRNRFLGLVRERHPWCISRERFWGCPLPVWNCTDCKNRDWFYTRADMVRAAADLPDGENFELHIPWIDKITIRCTKCGGTNTRRERYVLDTWHNSGSAPFSSLDDASYLRYIPAPFLTEGIDQTRGWAYTLLIENVIMSGKPASPFSSFLFQGHVLDENGGKMSKSLGNVIDAAELLQKYPVDAVRFYFLWKASPIEPLSFSPDELMSRPYQVLSTLYHLHLYYTQNSTYDGFNTTHTIQWAQENDLLGPPDYWLLSKLQGLVKKTGELNDRCKFHESARALEDYTINLLSQVYVPMTRGELWDEDESKKERRLAIYAVLSEVLRTLDVLLHPACPFITEYLHMGAFGKDAGILLQGWPEPDASLEDHALEESFDLLREVTSAASAARMRGKLKRRWPLAEAAVCIEEGGKGKLEPLSSLLASQLNVERLVIHEAVHAGGIARMLEMRELGLPVVPDITLDRKKVGPRARDLLGRLAAAFGKADPWELAGTIARDGSYKFGLGGREIAISEDDITVGIGAAKGYATSGRGGNTVFVSTSRSRELEARGLVKDIARRIQTLRKERGYDPTDVLDVASILGLRDDQLGMLKEQDLAFLVRVRRIDFGGSCSTYKDDDIDGQKIRIWVE